MYIGSKQMEIFKLWLMSQIDRRKSRQHNPLTFEVMQIYKTSLNSLNEMFLNTDSEVPFQIFLSQLINEIENIGE